MAGNKITIKLRKENANVTAYNEGYRNGMADGVNVLLNKLVEMPNNAMYKYQIIKIAKEMAEIYGAKNRRSDT